MNTEVMFSSKTDLWETPQELFDKYDAIYHFETDVCALPENSKCKRVLLQKWTDLSRNGLACAGVILHTVGRLVSGLKRQLNPLQLSSCFFLHEQTQNGFTIGACPMGRLNFCVGG